MWCGAELPTTHPFPLQGIQHIIAGLSAGAVAHSADKHKHTEERFARLADLMRGPKPKRLNLLPQEVGCTLGSGFSVRG